MARENTVCETRMQRMGRKLKEQIIDWLSNSFLAFYLMVAPICYIAILTLYFANRDVLMVAFPAVVLLSVLASLAIGLFIR